MSPYVPKRRSKLSAKRKKLFDSLERKEKRYKHKPTKKSFMLSIKSQGMKVERVKNMPRKKTLEHFRILDSKGTLHGFMVVKKRGQIVLNWNIS